MGVLILVIAAVAAIIACVVYVVLRDRRTSGERARFEPTQQGAPFTQESGINQQGNRNGSASL
ncbi:hypothetical protein Rhe02_19360 [Rhizocola hellebori]|uniref:Uncharacterized protein n=1 Tax=Rhizocola hellebori TaxID=1392758 RepID=A0A8J3Q4W7_9ACTN|nr:hypothetical protein [Rhizocola hellebori]GIH03869.1 hypothetical protein Rhe02_19360 [Rhizocola hellebori]